MYLTEIDEKTGLLLVSKSKDGIKAIKEFREILNDKKLGLKCLTAIALTADYLSPIRFYKEEDRPRASMEEVTGDRDCYVWEQPKIQNALKKYDALQYDLDVEEARLHRNRRMNILKKIKECENLSREEMMEKGYNISSLTKTLRQINSDIEDFEKRKKGNDIFKNNPVDGKYSLSRLEQKLRKKRSFYNSDDENVD